MKNIRFEDKAADLNVKSVGVIFRTEEGWNIGFLEKREGESVFDAAGRYIIECAGVEEFALEEVCRFSEKEDGGRCGEGVLICAEVLKETYPRVSREEILMRARNMVCAE